MKSRLEILEGDHDSALAQLIENELNITVLTRRSLVLKPGEDYNKVQALLMTKKGNVKTITEVLDVIEEMIEVEKKVKS